MLAVRNGEKILKIAPGQAVNPGPALLPLYCASR